MFLLGSNNPESSKYKFEISSQLNTTLSHSHYVRFIDAYFPVLAGPHSPVPFSLPHFGVYICVLLLMKGRGGADTAHFSSRRNFGVEISLREKSSRYATKISFRNLK